MPRGRKSQLHGCESHYCCEWNQCSKEFTNENELKTHQLQHFESLYQQTLGGEAIPSCCICDVSLELIDWNSWTRHSHYHAWTNCLRAKGLQIQQLQDWPPCLADTTSQKSVPDLPTSFECGWEFCDYQTDDIFNFLAHVHQHPEEYTDSRYVETDELKCLWEGCSYVAPRLKNLFSHLETHTQSKHVACPTCGLLLVNFAKLENHLKRQQIHLINKASDSTDIKFHHSVQPVRCSRCGRVFATEKLLLAHMQRHVNTVKCPLCEMTVYDRASLERHTLFRHTTEKPFACDHCEFRCKTASGLQRHCRLRHEPRDDPTTTSATTDCPLPPIRNPVGDTDLDNSSHAPPIVGPLAAAGALTLLNSSLSTAPTNSHSFLRNPNTFLRPDRIARSRQIRCTQLGCRFKTTNRIGYLVHLGRVHPEVADSLSPADYTPTGRAQCVHSDEVPGALYACHLCSVIKRRGANLSTHLMRAHQLTRPPGHVRFTYVLSDDGMYRLQLTRLDTVPVATAVLGENVMDSLLRTTPCKIDM